MPLFIGFVSAGVPLGVTFSFLIAGPMVGPVGLGLLYGLVGWQVATIYLVFGFTIGNVYMMQALMVGDDWLNDIVPAAEAGLLTYWIAPDDAVPADPSLLSGHGSLDKLADLVIGGRLQQLGA